MTDDIVDVVPSLGVPALGAEPGSSTLAGELGRALAGLRKRKGMTGEELGRAIGASQAKISKIERGALRPSPLDVEKIVLALDGSKDALHELVGQATELQALSSRPRLPRRGPVNQQDYADLESRATLVRDFEPITVPGLMQISEYTRRVINAFHAVDIGDHESKWAETAAKVTQRLQRQERLYDTNKTFEFILLENLLNNMYVTPGYMLAQVDRIEQIAKLPNVTVRVVPMTAQLGLPPSHGFMIFDDDVVVTESLDATVYQDRRSVEFYTHFFESYRELANADLDEVLERYKARYADMAMPKP
ncbi:helix-turn-helix domain-containing protein [Frankia sp. AgB1.9]|uniref:helix-turn-helix domain-containing protein n=1 Tax=unclassified Frankia TaxID=2632575 RepID=UPI0019313CAB|nr:MULTISPECIES: helix-turn-helix transcriptional regulator [unclassified Frankia]MBL7493834.1 helix-turn-helix domain-containing protein [Frankia sp. AgW1.1]MBL7552401.1 helix-turn-helix domain-containing protein [Frankia sp. AgB1.9]MBL7619626.1 helix-turn-helix domain-containing protein [Frankia sp. AgB1.8]